MYYVYDPSKQETTQYSLTLCDLEYLVNLNPPPYLEKIAEKQLGTYTYLPTYLHTYMCTLSTIYSIVDLFCLNCFNPSQILVMFLLGTYYELKTKYYMCSNIQQAFLPPSQQHQVTERSVCYCCCMLFV